MKQYLQYLLLLCCVVSLWGLTSCEEDITDNEEFVNWKATNDAAFKSVLSHAHQAIAAAKAAHGNDWEQHCEWRAFRAFTQAPESEGKATDSVCVQIIRQGIGSGCPEYTDSVSINYLGRLHPSPSYPQGFVFDHSSPNSRVEDVFNPNFAQPAGLLVSNTVVGFTTVLQKMHIGDRWKAYIPNELGYRGASMGELPAYSMLIFEMELKGYYRPGFGPNSPNRPLAITLEQ